MTKIATHNGKFHADEVFAFSLLRNLDRFKSSELIRTRDPELLKTADIVLDVGGVYDPANHRYDHHQPEFKDSFSSQFKTLLSSAGLVYKHFGKEIIAARAAHLSPEQVDALYVHVYESFVEPFDANDNGISAYPIDIKPTIARGFDIFQHVNLLNPGWNEVITPESSNASFMKAVEVVSEAFNLYLNNCLNFWLPARDIVQQAIKEKQISASASSDDLKILVLPTSCPWKDHLFNTAGTEDILYLIYPEGANASWRIQACPESPDSFVSRLPLPEAWRGLRDADLDAVLKDDGVEAGAIFIHRSGFIGGHKTKEGALAMARLAVRIGESSKKPRTE